MLLNKEIYFMSRISFNKEFKKCVDEEYIRWCKTNNYIPNHKRLDEWKSLEVSDINKFEKFLSLKGLNL